MKNLLLALACCCLLVGSATAQTIEYELPTEYNLVPGRLSVTFADSVSEAQALAVLAEYGYEVEEVRFASVKVFAVLAVPLSEEQRAFIEANPAVQTVHPVEFSTDNLPDWATPPPPSVHIGFESTTPEAEATGLLVQIDGLRIQKVTNLPKEMTIVVVEGEEDTVTETLSALPQVRYVSYLMADLEN